MASEYQCLNNLLDLIPPVDYQFNIGVVGDRDVGKSKLLDSFASHVNFHQTYRVGKTETCSNIVKIGDDKTVKLWVSKVICNLDWIRPDRRLEVTQFDGIIFVYDCNDVTTYSNVNSWIGMIDRIVPGVTKILVGNKCDSPSELKRVHAKTAQNFAKEREMQFLETSAKNSMNVKQAFTAIAAEIRFKLCSQTEEVTLTPKGFVASY